MMKHCNGVMHTVRQGDTLYSISVEYEVPLALLLRANPYVDVYNLQVGETVCVPVKARPQGILPPYGDACPEWTPGMGARQMWQSDAQDRETDANPDVPAEPEKAEMSDDFVPNSAAEMKEEADDAESQGSPAAGVEATAVRKETTGEKLGRSSESCRQYVTREGDTLEGILGVKKILLSPGMTVNLPEIRKKG